MKDWKVRQEVFYRMHQGDFKDQVKHENQLVKQDISDEELISDILVYFKENPDVLTYPAKSYFVAITYARLLSEMFEEDFYTALDDVDLLYGNDPFFKPYSDHKKVYDVVIEYIGDFDITKGQCPDVRDYFLEEFLVGQ